MIEARVEQYGDGITVTVPGDWQITGIEWEYHARWPLNREDTAKDEPGDGVASTILTLQAKRRR